MIWHCRQRFVTARSFLLRNNLVNRGVEIFLNRLPEVTALTNISSFKDLNVKLNSPGIWLLTLFHIRRITYYIYFSIRYSRHKMLPYFYITVICPISTRLHKRLFLSENYWVVKMWRHPRHNPVSHPLIRGSSDSYPRFYNLSLVTT